MINNPIAYQLSTGMAVLQSNSQRSLRGFFARLLLLFTAFFFIYFFEIESSTGLPYLLPLIFGSWIGFYWSPEKWKPVFFFLPFVLLIGFAFGALGSALYFVLALFFIFWIHIPLPRIIKWLCILGVVAAMVLVRSAKIDLPRIGMIIPYFASAFMFRWLIYLQEIKYKKVKEPLWMRMAYFFHPANLVFILYPVVDYRKFVNSYDPQKHNEAQNIAIERIFRSIFQYLLYRSIYFYVYPSFTSVQDAYSLLLYACAGYALILRISSIYYLCLGFVGLFGFNLPDVFNFYFLPTGFTQLWARINIYWKEFIIRIFYYPFYFRIRKIFPKNAIVLGTFYCFVITWFMHFYQLFWLKGVFIPKATDIIYWMVIGTGVTTTVYLIERKKIYAFSYLRYLHFKGAVILGVRVFIMLMVMSFLWILWQCDSVEQWWFAMRKITDITGIQLLTLVVSITFLIITGALIWLLYERKLKFYLTGTINYLRIVIPIILIVAGLKFAEKKEWIADHDIRLAYGSELNEADKERTEQGYYDQIISRGGNQLPWEVQLPGALDWSQANGATSPAQNLLLRELNPSVEINFKGEMIKTNQWGMRDKEYSLQKDKHVKRFILLGGSYEVGSGVENNEIYEAIAEDAVNHSFADQKNKIRIEIMNMALGGYYLPQAIYTLEKKALRFKPDYAIYTAHTGEKERLISNISKLVVHGIDVQYDFLAEVKNKSGVRQYMSRDEIKNRLYPYSQQLVEQGYKEFAAVCRRNGIQPVWMFVPALKHKIDPDEKLMLMQTARANGFIVIDISTAFEGKSHSDLVVSPTDNHPNPLGHKLLGHQLAGELIKIFSNFKK